MNIGFAQLIAVIWEEREKSLVGFMGACLFSGIYCGMYAGIITYIAAKEFRRKIGNWLAQ